MEGLLTPVNTSYRRSRYDTQVPVETPNAKDSTSNSSALLTTPEQALKILKNEPTYETLISVLMFLSKENANFAITSPSPLSAQLIHVLVSDIVPNFWSVLSQHLSANSFDTKNEKRPLLEQELLLACLRSVAGISAVVLGLKKYIQRAKEMQNPAEGSSIQQLLLILLQLLIALLRGDDTIERIWSTVSTSQDKPARQKAISQEFLAIFGGGKIVGISAEAENTVHRLSNSISEKQWVGDGSQYSLWLARNIVHWTKSIGATSEIALERCAELFGKSLRLGYTNVILRELTNSLLLQQDGSHALFLRLIEGLGNYEQRNVFYSILNIFSRDHLSGEVTTRDDANWWRSDAPYVSAVASLVYTILAENETRKNHLVSWLTSSTGAGVGDGIAIRRAVLTAMASETSCMERILEKSLSQFGDKLYIRHTPILQQEVHCQVLLLAAGHVHRQSQLHMRLMMRSGASASVVSNRLASSSSRARFLGMVVGEALSSLVDKAEIRMDFKIEEMRTPEAKWYKGLINVADIMGSFNSVRPRAVGNYSKKSEGHPSQGLAKPKCIPNSPESIAIEKILTDEECEDEGLLPYAKPDSDTEDEDEDPTLINRNRPTAPVYIRDLISYLRDTESYDRQKLALSTAAPLVRRKTNFGTEVTDHAEEIATLLVGIQDKYNIPDFADMRLQGMIAILIALPSKMGQWFSRTFFEGDYSLSQRSSVLTALGLGTRELGGFAAEDASIFSSPLPVPSFPSKTLPVSMEKHYDPQKPTKVDSLLNNLTKEMIKPMAASLADQLTGPSILKTRTFSSRLAVEKNKKKPSVNALSKIVAESFFFPLTGRFFLQLHSYSSSPRSVVFQPYLLSHFIKTLALILHAAGPYTASLPQMTSEFWDLLLSLRVQAQSERNVCEAVSFAFLTLLELNFDKSALVQTHARQILDTQEWLAGILGVLGGGGDDEKCHMLAAACLLRIRELVERYQRLLMGDMASF